MEKVADEKTRILEDARGEKDKKQMTTPPEEDVVRLNETKLYLFKYPERKYHKITNF